MVEVSKYLCSRTNDDYLEQDNVVSLNIDLYFAFECKHVFVWLTVEVSRFMYLKQHFQASKLELLYTSDSAKVHIVIAQSRMY